MPEYKIDAKMLAKIVARLKAIYNEATLETIAEKKSRVKPRRGKIKELANE